MTFGATDLVERGGIKVVGTDRWNEMIGRLLLIELAIKRKVALTPSLEMTE